MIYFDIINEKKHDVTLIFDLTEVKVMVELLILSYLRRGWSDMKVKDLYIHITEDYEDNGTSIFDLKGHS